jgi:hypothetical protein
MILILFFSKKNPSKAHVLKIPIKATIYMDFISSYLLHNSHLMHDNKIDY